MRTLPLLALSGCLVTHSDLTEEQETRCAPQIQRLEETCESQTGEFGEAVKHFKECLTEPVRVICSDPGLGEPYILTIKQ